MIEDIDSSNLTLANSRFVGNTAEASGVLDVIAADGTVTLNGDEFDHNNAEKWAQSRSFQLKSLTATDTSFIGNHGGFGAALLIDAGTLSLTNVTMSHNSSPTFGGALQFGTPGTPPSLTNVTIADNSAAPGEWRGHDGRARQWPPGQERPGCATRSSPTTPAVTAASGTAVSSSARVPAAVDAGLQPRQRQQLLEGGRVERQGRGQSAARPPADNGGSVLTDALQPGSPAIDAGTDTGCPASDARGVSRPQGASCDMGAFEFAAAGLALGEVGARECGYRRSRSPTRSTATNNGPGPSTATTVDRPVAGQRSTLFGVDGLAGQLLVERISGEGDLFTGAGRQGRERDGDDRRRRVRARDGHQYSDGDQRRGRGCGRLGGHGGQRAGAPGGAGAPKATTAAASAIGKHGVTLNGHINSGGQPTAYFFEYGKTSSLGNITTVRHAPSSVSVADTVSHLSPGTVYHYRLVAVNDSGSSKGSVRKFKTTGPGGALRLDGTKLEVSGRTVTATFTCASKKACSGSVTITVRLASKKAVLARGSLGRIRAGKRRSVSLSVRSGGLALLAKAPKQRLAGRLSARVGSGQRGLDRAVIVTLA